jgi:hypothetical protein
MLSMHIILIKTEKYPRLRSSLEAATQNKDDGADQDGPSTAKPVTRRTGEERSEERASSKQGNHHACLCFRRVE